MEVALDGDAVGIILTCSRILDGITDPLLAFVYDRVNTKFGKLRILLVAGYLIEALALYGMFTGFSSKGLGLPVFALLYVLYIIGYTVSNMTAQTIPSIMTNDAQAGRCRCREHQTAEPCFAGYQKGCVIR